jgi:hypothetical protein
VKLHFVSYYMLPHDSPSAIVALIDSWDVLSAIEHAVIVEERLGVFPDLFGFLTCECNEDDPSAEAVVVEQSNLYFLKGEIISLEELEARGGTDNEEFIEIMRQEKLSHAVFCNVPGEGWIHPLREGDVVLGGVPE